MKKILITLSILVILFSFTSCDTDKIIKDELIETVIDSDLKELDNYIMMYENGGLETRNFIDSIFIIYKENALEVKGLLKAKELYKSEIKVDLYLLKLKEFEK